MVTNVDNPGAGSLAAAAQHARTTRRLVPVLVAFTSLAAVALTAADSVYRAQNGWAGLTWALPNTVVGLLLTYRRPRLLTGWLFAFIGFLVSTGGAADVLATKGLENPAITPWWAVASTWYGEW
ncbi:MAG: hypothetical protein ICV72_12190, partial [Aldersonia sp.]|nr:hypothetical protein [Aldersonia sp.]